MVNSFSPIKETRQEKARAKKCWAFGISHGFIETQLQFNKNV